MCFETIFAGFAACLQDFADEEMRFLFPTDQWKGHFELRRTNVAAWKPCLENVFDGETLHVAGKSPPGKLNWEVVAGSVKWLLRS